MKALDIDCLQATDVQQRPAGGRNGGKGKMLDCQLCQPLGSRNHTVREETES